MNNPDSDVIFLQDKQEISIVNFIRSLPLEYGINGAVGAKYEALKDLMLFEKPMHYSKKQVLSRYLSLFYNLSVYYASLLKKLK